MNHLSYRLVKAVMEVVVVVLYRGSLAYYKVVDEKGKCRASLVKYSGFRDQPPEQIVFEKQGRHCTGTAEVELMDDLWDAVEETKEGTSLLVALNP